MTELRPMWSTTVHPSEYDIDEQMRDFVKAANKAKEWYYGIDVGKLWGLYTAYKEQADEITTLRAQLAEAQKTNERLVRRLNWIRVNPNDAVATRFALKATDEEIDDIKHLVITA